MTFVGALVSPATGALLQYPNMSGTEHAPVSRGIDGATAMITTAAYPTFIRSDCNR